MQTTELINQFPKGNPPIQLDVYKAVDYFIGLENVHEVEGVLNFTIIIDDSPHIFLNRNLSFKRKHFILTHELVEYLLEVDKTFYSLPYYFYKGSDKKFQARVNRIASELLMPESSVRSIVERTLLYTDRISNDFIKQLSDFFLVSETVVKIRLKNLNYEVFI